MNASPLVVPSRPLRLGTTWRRWLSAWLGAVVIGLGNATLREAAVRPFANEQTADQISVATGIALLGLYVWVLERRWPIATTRTALAIGGAWAALTVGFEFAFGHWVAGDSWAELGRNYDVTAGRLWPLLVLWVAVAPALLRALRARRA